MTVPQPRDTLGTNMGGYVDPPFMAEIRAAADLEHLARAALQTLTLGLLIEQLQDAPQNVDIELRGCGLDGHVPSDIDSWRGCYADLALHPGPPEVGFTVAQLLQLLHGALDRTFEGYKGGDFSMDTDTPVWVDAWGECTFDRGITAVRPLLRGGQVVTVLLVLTDHSRTDS